MDLRKKTSPLRSLGEILLRFRLVLVAMFAVLYVVFARDFQSSFSYAGASAEYLLELFGQNASLAPLKGFAAPVSVGCVILFLACFLFARVAVLKTFLPALLVAFFWTSLSAGGNLPYVEYQALLLADILGIVIAGISAGISLKNGFPVAGSLTVGFSRAFFPILALHLLVGCVFGYLFRADAEIWTLAVFPPISFALFLFAEFPMFSFAPMGKMRAGHRTMKI